MTPERGLTRTLLTHHQLRVAVRAGHHLASRQALSLDELAGERIMVWGHPGRSGYTDLLIDHCRAAGFEPHIERNPVQGTPPVTAVIDTDHVAFVTAAPGPAANGHVQVLDLHPPAFVPAHALWPPHIPSDARDTFLHATTN